MNTEDYMSHEYQPILDFWYQELTPEQWFRDGKSLDSTIRERFGELLEKGKRGDLDDWASTPLGRLALIILLDQFSRHIFRDTPEAYAADAKAQLLSREGIEASMDDKLKPNERHFFYMPLMHAEDKELQKLSLEKFEALAKDSGNGTEFAQSHASTVMRFGRFPHRNTILGRESTPEEEKFLASS